MAETIPKFQFGDEPVLPDRDSYKLGVPFGALITDIGNGPVRSRASGLNNSVNVSCTYTFEPYMTQWFNDLWFTELREGQLPLEVRLDLNGSDLSDETWYVATIVNISAPTYTGLISKYTITFNAVPKIDRAVSEARLLIYEAFGKDAGWAFDNIDGLLDPLERFL